MTVINYLTTITHLLSIWKDSSSRFKILWNWTRILMSTWRLFRVKTRSLRTKLALCNKWRLSWKQIEEGWLIQIRLLKLLWSITVSSWSWSRSSLGSRAFLIGTQRREPWRLHREWRIWLTWLPKGQLFLKRFKGRFMKTKWLFWWTRSCRRRLTTLSWNMFCN